MCSISDLKYFFEMGRIYLSHHLKALILFYFNTILKLTFHTVHLLQNIDLVPISNIQHAFICKCIYSKENDKTPTVYCVSVFSH